MKINIPITRPYLGREEKELISEVIDSGWVSQGLRVQEFEERFAEYVGAGYAVATTSCTTALHAALSVYGIRPGDEVIVPSLSFIATANAVVHCGATPVFVDIDPETCNIDVQKIEQAVTRKTSAVIPVHQMGLPAEIDTIQNIAGKHGLKIIEDAACAIGSSYRGKKIGGHGNVACFSLHPRKVITTGEGGMITTDNADLTKRLKRFRNHGMSISDIERHTSDRIIIETYPEIGYNFRMTDIQAAMGIAQLKRLPFILEKRRQKAVRYDKALKGIPCIRVPAFPAYFEHNYQSYWIEILGSAPVSRDMFMERMLEKGISTRRGIMDIHSEQCYKGYLSGPLPVTEKISLNTVLLPLYPGMSDNEQEYVINSVREILEARR